MNVLRWDLLVPLGRTLLTMAELLGAVSYAEHYRRDLGLAPAAAPGTREHSLAAEQEPPDMFRALQQLLSGQYAAAPLLVQQHRPCCQRSVNLLACYKPAHREHTGAAALDASGPRVAALWCGAPVTPGARNLKSHVALPIAPHTLAQCCGLQALHQCRSKPPASFPREAFVLMGTLGCAASMQGART